MAINCIVIDDEYPARLLLNEYISQLSYLELLQTFGNPVEALNFLNDNQVDLIFLDIQMPEITGLEFLKVLDPKPMVILTTAYKDYALKGYELDVLDYLLKPIQFDRFLQAVVKAKNLFDLHYKLPHQPTNSDKTLKNYITVKADRKIFKISFDEINYIQGLREYVTFHTQQGKVISLNSLKSLEETLPGTQFMRIHKSYIINKLKVDSLYGNCLLIKDAKIPFSKNLKERIIEEIFS